MKYISLFTILFFTATLGAQVYWPLDRINTSGYERTELGTTSSNSLNIITNDSVRLTVYPNGFINIPKLSGDGFRLLYVDSLGNLSARGGGGPNTEGFGVTEDGSYCNRPTSGLYDMAPCPSLPCVKNAGPWFEGGNYIGTNGNNAAGTCSNHDFILKAGGNQFVWVKTSGKIGIGTSSPAAKLHVYENTALGGSALDNLLIRTYAANVAGSNTLKSNLWVLRGASGSDWNSSVLHDAISIDGSFVTPRTDSKTWWERNPSEDTQAWGTDSITYMKLSQGTLYLSGKIYLGPQVPKTLANGGTHWDAKLSVSGKLIAKEIYVNTLTGTWADYVFAKDYKLKSLEQVEDFIVQNKRLPNIPSAAELEKEYSLNVGDMQRLQMEKIEEIFLYLIEQKKEIIKLKEENESLRNLVNKTR